MQIELNVSPLSLYTEKKTLFKTSEEYVLAPTTPIETCKCNLGIKQTINYDNNQLEIERKYALFQPQDVPLVNPVPPWQWNPPIINTDLGTMTKQNHPILLKQTALQTIHTTYADFFISILMNL